MRAEEQLKLAYTTIAELKEQNAKLVDAGKLYGRKSEKSCRLRKRRDDDDCGSGKDNFDGTHGSDESFR